MRQVREVLRLRGLSAFTIWPATREPDAFCLAVVTHGLVHDTLSLLLSKPRSAQLFQRCNQQGLLADKECQIAASPGINLCADNQGDTRIASRRNIPEEPAGCV